MSDAGLLFAAMLGMVLTAGAILRDTRHRVGLLDDETVMRSRPAPASLHP